MVYIMDVGVYNKWFSCFGFLSVDLKKAVRLMMMLVVYLILMKK
jgi:hypothetical protein